MWLSASPPWRWTPTSSCVSNRNGPGARQEPAGSGGAADETCPRLRRRFAPLAHPAGPLRVPGTQAALLGMPGGAVLRLSAQDACTATPLMGQGTAARAAGKWRTFACICSGERATNNIAVSAL